MSKFPFTPAGVEDKCEELYSLSDAALEAEATAVRTNFRSWMNDNFVLDSAQLTYLNGMNNTVLDFYGEQCAFCFLHRLPIYLEIPPAVPFYSKWTGSRNDIKAQTNGEGKQTITGSLTFTMVYEP